MASTRFPGKPLVDLNGKPMVQWVYEAAVRSGVSDRVVIATPDAEIVEVARRFGAETCLTHDRHPSGTDRLAEVAESMEAEAYLNLQGDEPLMPASNLSVLSHLLEEAPMASLYTECAPEDENNNAVVKVVTDLNGYALYFSRHAVPFARNPRKGPLKRHLGLYGYRREVLQAFAQWQPTELETTESLEQLRFLEHGVRIKMALGKEAGTGVDTPEQAELVRAMLHSQRV
jgi:3-deoxy-manno-octulosonate cytidylyltransferase (CMP-KDO synthetase)